MTAKKKASLKLAALAKAFDERQDEKAIAMARALIEDPDPGVALEARRILALCLFESKAYGEASGLWGSMFNESEKPEDWVSVVTSHIRAGKLDEADRYFEPALNKLNAASERASQDGVGWRPSMMTGAHLYFYYADEMRTAGFPDRALPKVKHLATLYSSLAITDDHFLITRGMVPFGHFCRLLELLDPAARQHPMWAEILQGLRSHLDEEGRFALRKFKSGSESGA